MKKVSIIKANFGPAFGEFSSYTSSILRIGTISFAHAAVNHSLVNKYFGQLDKIWRLISKTF